MSKSKKIAMTSAVAMVTAGVTTASNLTFTTKASANSHHHKKTSSTTKAVKYLQKQGLTKKQAKMVVSSDDFSNGHSTVENMHWNRRVKDVHQAGQKAYNKAIHSGKSKAQARANANYAATKRADKIAGKYYGGNTPFSASGSFKDQSLSGNNLKFHYTGGKNGHGHSKKASISNKKLPKSAIKLTDDSISKRKGNGAEKNNFVTLNLNKDKHTTHHHNSNQKKTISTSNGTGTKHQTTATTGNGTNKGTNTSRNKDTAPKKAKTNTTVSTSQKVKADTASKGTKLSKSIKSLDSKEQESGKGC